MKDKVLLKRIFVQKDFPFCFQQLSVYCQWNDYAIRRTVSLCITCLYPHIQTTTFSDQKHIRNWISQLHISLSHLPTLKISLLIIHLPTAWRKHHSVNCLQRSLGSIPIPDQSSNQSKIIWVSFLDSRYKQCWFLPLPFTIGWKRKNRLCVYCVYVYQHTNYCFLTPKASLQSSPVRCVSPSAVSLFSNYHYWYFTYQQLGERSIQSCVPQWSMVSCSQRECRGY